MENGYEHRPGSKTEKRVLDTDLIRAIAEFERITHARVQETFEHQNKLVVVVGRGDAKKCVGPEGKTLRIAEQKLGRRFKIIEMHPEMLTFIRNAMLPLRATKIEETGDGVVTVTGPDEKTRGLMIGAKAQNLRFTEKVVQRYFPQLKEIKVIG